MTLAFDNITWPPSRSPRSAVLEDRCVAHADAPMKDWVYETPAIGFVLSGWFDYLAEDHVAFGAPGAIVFGNAGQHFNVRHHDANGNRRLVVLLNQATLDEIANDAGLDSPRFGAIALPPGPRATRMYAAMRAMADTGEMADDQEFELAYAALSAPAPKKRGRAGARDRKRALSAARHIETHFSERCPLATLAEVAQTSRYQLVRAFSAVMGLSPNQYLINTRVRAAAERLRSSNTPITAIALDVGFNDVSHFYACFRAALGQTPRRWRLAN